MNFELNKRVAELLGWTKIKEKTEIANGYHGQTYMEGKNPDGFELMHVPNYSGDLNAMHEAEKIMNEDQRVEYINKFPLLFKKSGVFATAAQRAEAFIRTMETTN